MPTLFDAMTYMRGPQQPNRFMLAPMTNSQSHDDGTLGDDEYKWLIMRAEGGFGATMTCAAHVQAAGQGFPGELGIFSDDHIPGLTRLASGIKDAGSLAIAQVFHGGMRAQPDLTGQQPLSASDDEETGAREMTTAEVEQLTEDFIAAAKRAEQAGFDGVEVHGAHGYILCQFLSPEINRRSDKYGGSLENRARLLLDVVAGIRAACRDDFNVSVRLSPERFGMRLAEARDVAQQLLSEGQIDFLDMSLWDVRKEPVEEEFQGRTLMSYFTELDRGDVRLGVAGKIYDAETARWCLDEGCDFVLIGRGAILHHDYPNRVHDDEAFKIISRPVTSDYLRDEGLGEAFIDYMKTWRGFVEDEI